MDEQSILLDLGGDYFNGSSLPIFSNGLDANLYLKNLQDRFRLFTENRLLVTNLITRLGSDLASIDWYKEITYTTYLNDLENANFTGTVSNRYKQVKELGIDKALRISILGGTQSGIFLGVKEKYLEFASDVANCLVSLDNKGVSIPKIRIMMPNASSDDFIERALYRELKNSDTDNNVVVDVMFVLKDNTEFTDFINSEAGMSSLIAWVVNSIDKITKRKVEKDE